MVVLATLGLVGCGVRRDRSVGTSQTTSAVVLATAICPPAAPATSNATGPVDEGELSPRSSSAEEESGGPVSAIETTPVNGESAAVPYLRPPLYESNGSTFSDVGIPYPLPSVVEPPPAPTGSSMPQPALAPFFETSFGPGSPSSPSSDSNGFPESSFGEPQ